MSAGKTNVVQYFNGIGLQRNINFNMGIEGKQCNTIVSMLDITTTAVLSGK